ncbi:hypothetical protein MFUM_700010 [Methylacidiphilum fumariolicum SolV]|uniref:Uncharacterized protein n=2 Tax=Candidatus Methylacidiphilum fumarolicum TaxID=591154 RepID=I0JYZ2_METFB|nr:conserved protein of unknown function [Candidatus Methylacidiphilum fumarolicum]CCG92461.1 hypothetical protein MFUM_700010 [Methylacidiphilum fumariolicum SolV]
MNRYGKPIFAEEAWRADRSEYKQVVAIGGEKEATRLMGSKPPGDTTPTRTICGRIS